MTLCSQKMCTSPWQRGIPEGMLAESTSTQWLLVKGSLFPQIFMGVNFPLLPDTAIDLLSESTKLPPLTCQPRHQFSLTRYIKFRSLQFLNQLSKYALCFTFTEEVYFQVNFIEKGNVFTAMLSSWNQCEHQANRISNKVEAGQLQVFNQIISGFWIHTYIKDIFLRPCSKEKIDTWG